MVTESRIRSWLDSTHAWGPLTSHARYPMSTRDKIYATVAVVGSCPGFPWCRPNNTLTTRPLGGYEKIESTFFLWSTTSAALRAAFHYLCCAGHTWYLNNCCLWASVSVSQKLPRTTEFLYPTQYPSIEKIVICMVTVCLEAWDCRVLLEHGSCFFLAAPIFFYLILYSLPIPSDYESVLSGLGFGISITLS